MTWARRFRIEQYIRSSLWLLPLIGGVLGVVLGESEVLLDQHVTLPASLTYSATTASTILSAIVGAMAFVIGFVVTVTVLVVQTATGLFSARYLRLWYRDWMLKVSLALLTGTLAFSFALLRRVEAEFVPNVGVSVAGLLVIASVLTFLIFLDRCLHRLRPVAVIALVAGYVRQGLERDEQVLAASNDVFLGVFEPGDAEPALVVHSETAGAVQAIDYRGLERWAREHDQLVVVTHTIGDFVPAGANLIEAYGGAGAEDDAERRLLGMIALGRERTIDQDPSFGIRIIVDIADHALSAAVNDPTTAVQAIDHLGELLRLVGTLELSRSVWSGDPNVHTGVIIRVRSWEDYLTLAATEIREYGSTSISVMRRMRAMLEELCEEVRPEHRPAVREELSRLGAAVVRNFGDSVDLDRALTADPQGIGGRTGPRALSS